MCRLVLHGLSPKDEAERFLAEKQQRLAEKALAPVPSTPKRLRAATDSDSEDDIPLSKRRSKVLILSDSEDDIPLIKRRSIQAILCKK